MHEFLHFHVGTFLHFNGSIYSLGSNCLFKTVFSVCFYLCANRSARKMSDCKRYAFLSYFPCLSFIFVFCIYLCVSNPQNKMPVCECSAFLKYFILLSSCFVTLISYRSEFYFVRISRLGKCPTANASRFCRIFRAYIFAYLVFFFV